MLIESCPCCGNRLLLHANSSGAYLLCTSCRLEIPEDIKQVVSEPDNQTANEVVPSLANSVIKLQNRKPKTVNIPQAS